MIAPLPDANFSTNSRRGTVTRLRKALRTKRRKAAVIIAVLALIPAGAFAYLDAHGTTTITNGNGGEVSPTGVAASWAITLGSPTPTGSYLIPGGTTAPPTTWETVQLTVTNSGSQDQKADPLTAVTASVTSSGGNIEDAVTHNPITNCSASWFTATYVPAIGDPSLILVPAGSTWASVESASPNFDQITLSMSESGTDQSACEGHEVSLTVTVAT
jgi:hypothetical protein